MEGRLFTKLGGELRWAWCWWQQGKPISWIWGYIKMPLKHLDKMPSRWLYKLLWNPKEKRLLWIQINESWVFRWKLKPLAWKDYVWREHGEYWESRGALIRRNTHTKPSNSYKGALGMPWSKGHGAKGMPQCPAGDVGQRRLWCSNLSR